MGWGLRALGPEDRAALRGRLPGSGAQPCWRRRRRRRDWKRRRRRRRRRRRWERPGRVLRPCSSQACPLPLHLRAHRLTAHRVRRGTRVGAGWKSPGARRLLPGSPRLFTPGQHNRGPPLWLLSSQALLWPAGGGRQLKRWKERKGPAPSPPARSP